MIDPLELAQHIAAGQPLATVGDIDYRVVDLVCYLDDAGPHIYCTAAEWRHSLAGMLAEKDKTIAELETTLSRQQELVTTQQQRIAELEQRRAAAPTPTPAPAPARPHAHDGRALPYGRVQCPHCEKTPWQIQLAKHIQNCHRVALIAPATEEPTELSDAQIKRRLGVPPDWMCAGCERGDRPQSIKNPAYCVECARAQPRSAAPAQAGAL